MAPKSRTLKILTMIAFVWLFVILLMNVFNSGHSYYYSRILRHLENGDTKQTKSSWNRQMSDSAAGSGLSDEDAFTEYSNRGMTHRHVI